MNIIKCDVINFESEHVYELVSNSKVNIKWFILPSSSYEKYKQVSRSLKWIYYNTNQFFQLKIFKSAKKNETLYAKLNFEYLKDNIRNDIFFIQTKHAPYKTCPIYTIIITCENAK